MVQMVLLPLALRPWFRFPLSAFRFALVTFQAQPRLAADRRRPGEEVHDLELEEVGVLEFVDEDGAIPRAALGQDTRLVPEEVPRADLEVFEIEGRLLGLRRLVGFFQFEFAESLLHLQMIAAGIMATSRASCIHVVTPSPPADAAKSDRMARARVTAWPL